MSFVSWSLVLVFNYLAMYALNSLKLGGLMLGLSFSISVGISFCFLSWLSLMFFLMYMGGLLVLFFYLSSLKYNPLFSSGVKYKMMGSVFMKVNVLLIVGLCMLFYKFENNMKSFKMKKMNKYSYSLFNEEEVLILMLVGMVLLMVLWLVTKLTCKSRGALRPIFGDKSSLSFLSTNFESW